MNPTQAEKVFDTGELTIRYDEAGGSGNPLVLLHGLTSRRIGYSPLIPTLAAGWHVYAPDFRGHGTSDRAKDNQYHNADYARDIIAFLEHIGKPAVLVGHSLGAMVAMVVAARYPQGVRGLTLLDPPLFSYTGSVRLQPETTKWFELVTSVMKDSPSPDVVVERLRKMMPDTPEEQITGMTAFIATTAAGTTEIALRDEIWQGVDLPRSLESIRCPVLLIHGDWSAGGAVRDEDISFFTSHCPTATIVRLPGADHGLSMRERPELVLGAFGEKFSAG